MMYRCEGCGHLFEEGEQAVWEETHGLDHGPYERCDGCPLCCGGYDEVHQCKECGDWHTEDELREGWCENCLREAIDYKTAFSFLRENDMLSNFMFESVWESPEPEKASKKLLQALEEMFFRMRANDLLCNSHEFIDICKKYIMDDDGDCGKVFFSEWLNNREVK